MAERTRTSDTPEPQPGRTNATAATGGEAGSAPASDAAESTYARDELMGGATGFGVQAETVAGAWHLAGWAPDERVTRSQMEAAIEAFNTREVGPS